MKLWTPVSQTGENYDLHDIEQDSRTWPLRRWMGPCEDGWVKLLSFLGKTKADDEPLPLLTILESNGFDDTLWCLRSVPEHNREWRLFAVWCARKVQHLMKDPRSLNALDVAERFANGLAHRDELNAAWDAARAAARDAAWDAAWDEQKEELIRIIS